MKKLTHIGLVIGLLLFVGLLVWQGVLEVVNLLLSSGWELLWLPIVWLPSIFPTTESWRLCFHNDRKPKLYNSLVAMWIGRAVNNLLPVATIGGEIIKARLATLNGSGVKDASASVMVDKTLQALALILWGLIGMGLLIFLSLDDGLAVYVFSGFLLLTAGVLGFMMVQKHGMFSLFAKLGGVVIKTEAWEGVSIGAREIDTLVMDIYKNRTRFIIAVFYKTLGLILQTTEVWLACYLLGHPIGILEALMLKSLTATISDIAFIIPNAYGIQEGAFIMIGALLGFGPELALALSLAIRVREVVIDVPGLILWHQIESRHLLKRQSLGH